MSTYNFLDKTGLGLVWAKIKALIPTKTSDLTNDSGFVSETYVDSELAKKMPIVTYGTISEISETTVAFSKDGDNDWYISGSNPKDGLTFDYDTVYKIEWDGTEYECFNTIIQLINSAGNGTNSAQAIGNCSIIGYENTYNTSAPFVIIKRYIQSEPDNFYILTSSSAASHRIKITFRPFTKTIIPKQYYENTQSGHVAGGIGSGSGSFVANYPKEASGTASAAFGRGNSATGDSSVAFGMLNIVSGVTAFASGGLNKSTGFATTTENAYNTASGNYSHAEGYATTSSGAIAHSEGHSSIASGKGSHAEGAASEASGYYSHAEGRYTIANHRGQHVFGSFNIADPSGEAATANGNYIEIVGNGTADDARSNARTLDWDGNEILAGKLTLGVGPTANMDAATKQYVDNTVKTYTLSMSGNRITLTPSSGTATYVDLPVYNGGVSS